jgi:alkanesulfonate monooxygenase SsuD/methylene tetrahydromethanopterin reductase-like flavin-dependent oxidoreductase (luciferase family)
MRDWVLAEPPAPIPVVPPRQRPEPLRPPNPPSSPAPPVVPAASSGEQHAQLARLLDEGVIDEEQAVYLRSVLFG